jgi:hypothetical protein
MKPVLTVVALAEMATGVALLVLPELFGRLLFGVALDDLAVAIARAMGIALVALGFACWPGPAAGGMLIYSAGVMLYLAYLGLAGTFAGVLLWPVVVAHLVASVLIAGGMIRARAA